MNIKVLVVESFKFVREATCFFLSNKPEIEVVGQAEDGRAAVKLAQELRPHVIIMDVVMPRLNGIDATRKIIQQLPNVKIIALSACTDRRSVREMLKAGASGYLPKHCTAEELIVAIQKVNSNQTYLSPEINEIVFDEYVNGSPECDGSVYSVLTDRGREVLQLVSEGKSTKQIARELNVSTKTIDWHRSQLMSKLGFESVAELVKYAIREGLTCAEV